MNWQGKVALRDLFSPEYERGAVLFERGDPPEKCLSRLSRAGWEDARRHKRMMNAFFPAHAPSAKGA